MDSSSVNLLDGTLNQDQTMTFTVSALTAAGPETSATWTIQASDATDGTNFIYCDGGLNAAISGAPAVSTPKISQIVLSNLTATTVTLTWKTDLAASSRVDYGLTTAYGQTQTAAPLVTSHALALTGLTPNAGYHYRLASVSASGATGYSGDNTWLTPVVVATPTPAPTATATPTSSPSPTATPTSGLVASPSPLAEATPSVVEHTPPQISLTAPPDKPYRQAPDIDGQASDNVGVVRLDYSLDDGLSWLPVEIFSGLGRSSVTFTVRPETNDDGNYSVVARATDGAGNASVSAPVTMVIDRLPPRFVVTSLMLGPQPIWPRPDGRQVVLAGMDQRLTMRAAGGPTRLIVTAVADGVANQAEPTNISLTQTGASGQWSGVLGLAEPGNYRLTAEAEDGAHNVTRHELSQVTVVGLGQIVSQPASSPLTDATVTLYYREPVARTWGRWDGRPYGQTNPQTTDRRGGFGYVLPAGDYYLVAQASGYRTVASQLFHLKELTLIHPRLALDVARWWQWWPRQERITLAEAEAPPSAVSTSLPDDWQITTLAGKKATPVNLLGKPTVVAFIDPLAPEAQDQLRALGEVQANSDVGVVPIVPLESSGRLKAQLAISRLSLDAAVDPDGDLLESWGVAFVPTMVFISRQGIVKERVTAILSKETILDHLGRL